ncbi:MAG: redox-sensing transcriptional repressor Rex [Gemmatimonadota bacterium]|jgi:redox-sensing transcriptional repressor
MNDRKISDSTVRRLSLYLNLLRELSAADDEVVSSLQLAEGSGTTAAQVRKDLSHFGSFGKRGQGYRVSELHDRIRDILGLEGTHRVSVVGTGKIGSALLGYRDLRERGFEIVSAFDTDPDKAGREVFGVPVYPMDDLEGKLRADGVDIVIIATPPAAAQEVADRVAAAGVEGILSFAASKLQLEVPIAMRWMDVALELEGLSFLMSNVAHGPRSIEESA